MDYDKRTRLATARMRGEKNKKEQYKQKDLDSETRLLVVPYVRKSNTGLGKRAKLR